MLRIVLIVILAIVAILVVAVFLLHREPPRMPRDKDHVTSRTEKQCLDCHGPGEKNARTQRHPNANDCFRCHLIRDAS